MVDRPPPVLVLAGGLGTRLAEVSRRLPKPMADVGGRPFLEFVLRHLAGWGVPEAILCIGYKAEVIERHFGERAFGMRIRLMREDAPLGTAGALRLALPYVGERVLAVNGDSFADVDVAGLLAFHREQAPRVTIVGVQREDASRFGTLRTDGPRLHGFEEKRPERGPGIVNAGVYVLEKSLLESVAEGRAVSLEREVLPGLLAAHQRVAVYRHPGYFEDIGVPEGYAAFRAAAPKLWKGMNMGIDIDAVRRDLEESIAVKSRLDHEFCERVAELARRTVACIRAGGKVVIFGNGGSAADAQHIAAELVGRFERERPPMRAMALTTNTSTLTALANDYDYDVVFARQVEAWVEPRDVVIGISTSGNSKNVLRALEAGRRRGAYLAAFTGDGGGACAGLCDLLLAVPSKNTARIQECHITIGHILSGLVERAMTEAAPAS